MRLIIMHIISQKIFDNINIFENQTQSKTNHIDRYVIYSTDKCKSSTYRRIHNDFGFVISNCACSTYDKNIDLIA